MLRVSAKWSLIFANGEVLNHASRRRVNVARLDCHLGGIRRLFVNRFLERVVIVLSQFFIISSVDLVSFSTNSVEVPVDETVFSLDITTVSVNSAFFCNYIIAVSNDNTPLCVCVDLVGVDVFVHLFKFEIHAEDFFFQFCLCCLFCI